MVCYLGHWKSVVAGTEDACCCPVSSVFGVLQALATVFLQGFAGSPSEGLTFVFVPCHASEGLWMGAAVLDVGL